MFQKIDQLLLGKSLWVCHNCESALLDNKTFHLNYIKLYPNRKYWRYYGHKLSHEMPLVFIKNHLDKNWDWHVIALRPDLNMKFVQEKDVFMKILPYITKFMYNKKISVAFVIKKCLELKYNTNSSDKINWHRLSKNVCATDFLPGADPKTSLVQYIGRPWDWKIINENYLKIIKKQVRKLIVWSQIVPIELSIDILKNYI